MMKVVMKIDEVGDEEVMKVVMNEGCNEEVMMKVMMIIVFYDV